MIYWNFIDPWGDEHVLECATPEEALEWADEWFAKRSWEDGCCRNGQTVEGDGFLVALDNDGDSEPVMVEKRKIKLVYEHYHGDLAEHGTY